jgi:hypothetical protein
MSEAQKRKCHAGEVRDKGGNLFGNNREMRAEIDGIFEGKAAGYLRMEGEHTALEGSAQELE